MVRDINLQLLSYGELSMQAYGAMRFGFETDHAGYEGDATNLSSMPEMNHTPSGTTSQMLMGGYSSQVGATRSLHVYLGDKVKAEVHSK